MHFGWTSRASEPFSGLPLLRVTSDLEYRALCSLPSIHPQQHLALQLPPLRESLAFVPLLDLSQVKDPIGPCHGSHERSLARHCQYVLRAIEDP